MSCAYCKNITVCAICGKGITASAFLPEPAEHEYPACGMFRGGQCTCVLQDPPDSEQQQGETYLQYMARCEREGRNNKPCTPGAKEQK